MRLRQGRAHPLPTPPPAFLANHKAALTGTGPSHPTLDACERFSGSLAKEKEPGYTARPQIGLDSEE